MSVVRCCLLICLLILGPVDPHAFVGQTDPFLERQRTAMRPEFQADIDRLSDVPRYSIQASLDPETSSVQGNLVIRYIHRDPVPASEMVFRLPAAATLYGGGEISITNTTVEGKPSQPIADSSLLVIRVPLGESLIQGESVQVEIGFHTRLPASTANGYGILGRARRVISLAGWYPILAVYQGGWQVPEMPEVGDGLFAETSLYEVELKAPDGWQVAASGVEKAGRSKDGQTTWQIISGPAREMALAISDRFTELTSTVDGVELRYFSLPAGDAKNNPQAGMDAAGDYLSAYEARFGPYPWAELDLVDSSISIGGYEFPGMVYVEYGLRVRGPSADYRWILAHEIAHQWWYGLIGSDQIRDPWLDEALATYSAYLAIYDVEGSEVAARLWRGYRSRANEAGLNELPFRAATLDFDDWRSYNRVVYYRGALFLEAFKKELGGAAFAQLLWTYSGRYRYQVVEPEDFLALAEELTGRDLTAFYQRWSLVQ